MSPREFEIWEMYHNFHVDTPITWYRDGRGNGRTYQLELAKDPTYRMTAKKVIFHDPATIVIWVDGTKTVVKCSPEDVYDKEKGLALCYMKKALGNKGNYNNVFRKWITPEGREFDSFITKSFNEIMSELDRAVNNVIKDMNKE